MTHNAENDALHQTLLAFSEWLDSEGLIVSDQGDGADKRAHDDLAAEFVRKRATPPVEPIRCATRCSQWPDCRHDWTWFENCVTSPEGSNR